ncbi:unnamed protein product [Rhizoctonia solani]|uniref:Extracellular metalloproteinase n=1 Tax=Rhizoctonia solani TaxID=456999 RepID=A0A8H3APP2_9AGAM|nr:unnamed protein product [Rhizoctonia solani]
MRILSRAYVLASVVSFLPVAVSAHYTSRRTLNFSPPRLGAKFLTDPLPILSSRDAFQATHAFLHRLACPDDGYFIRKDSYTDANTGISHIYVRQVVNGLEVVDGNINLNIRNGRVLSYGNSFFEGSAKLSLLSVPNWHQAIYCSESSTSPQDPACGSVLNRLQAIASLHSFDQGVYRHDPRAAAFFFLQVAHPDPTSLSLTLTSLEAKRHECTDPLEEDMSCEGWFVTSHSDELDPIRARQVYIQTPDVGGLTNLNLAWRLEMSLPENHYVAYVSVHDPSKIISLADLVVDAPAPDSDGLLVTLERYIYSQLEEALPSPDSLIVNFRPGVAQDGDTESPFPTAGTYHVWKWGVNDPDSGNRTLEVAPTDTRRASPLGWHSVPAGKDPLKAHYGIGKDVIVNYTTTVGNNVIVQENWAGKLEWKTNGRPDGGPNLIFDFPRPYGADPSEDPKQYINASITQLFYAANMYHDLMYLYGFDEVSGNYQQYNFGKGGAEGDAIILDAQHGGGFNGAFFVPSSDGTNGRCRINLFDKTKPFRDGGLDTGILIHELSHGLSTRLTGGPRNLECLKDKEAVGLGEGWSDFIATVVQLTRTYTDYPFAAWASRKGEGIRDFPYSMNWTTNPSKYDRIQYALSFDGVHMIGQVWAEILYVVSHKLVEKHGFADSLFPFSQPDFYRFVAREDGALAKVPTHGNTLMLQLVVNGMKIQSCFPTFIIARDAIIEADRALTGGENKCTLWNAFASRGLGSDAKNLTFRNKPSINGYNVPPECK